MSTEEKSIEIATALILDSIVKTGREIRAIDDEFEENEFLNSVNMAISTLLFDISQEGRQMDTLFVFLQQLLSNSRRIKTENQREKASK